MLKETYLRAMGRSERLVARIATGRWWMARAVVLAILLSLFISFPRISFFLGNDPQIVSNWSIIRSQARDPLSMSADQLANQASHASKLAFRLTVPMIVRVLHIDWPGALALQFCVGVALLFLAGKIALDLFGDRIVAVATIFGVSAIYAGKAAFLQLGGFFDAFAYFFLTVAIAFRNPLLIAIAILAASFTDERAMVIAPLVLVYWAVRSQKAEGPNWFTAQSVAVVAALVAAVVIRLVLMLGYGLHIPVGAGKDAGFDVLLRTLPSFQYEFPHVLAGLWLWPLFACILLVRARWWMTLILMVGGTAALTAVSFLVLDVDRSLAYSLPVLFVAMAVAAVRHMALGDARSIAILGLVISLLFPVNNLLGSVHNRHSVGNLLPVEMVRFYHYATHR
jgi:hypothetical protein